MARSNPASSESNFDLSVATSISSKIFTGWFLPFTLILSSSRQTNCPQPAVGVFADHNLNLVLLGDALETRGQVHVIAHHRPRKALGVAHAAEVDLAGIQADTDGERRAVLLLHFA